MSSILNSWVPDLEQAQSISLQALNQAEGRAHATGDEGVLRTVVSEISARPRWTRCCRDFRQKPKR